MAPPLVAAAVLVVALMSFSGCLHLDGLSDTADGFFSCRSRERMLEIMKDSHAGPMGLIAVVGVLLLKFAALGVAGPGEPVAGRVADAAGRTDGHLRPRGLVALRAPRGAGGHLPPRAGTLPPRLGRWSCWPPRPAACWGFAAAWSSWPRAWR